MILTIHERLKLLEILPKEEDYKGMREIVRTINLLSLTDEEAKELDAKFEEGRMFWNIEKSLTMDKDIPFGEWITEAVREVLYNLNKDHKIAADLMSIYEKFVMDYE